jgi:hypothetical protein
MHDTLSYFSKDPIHRQHHHHQLTFGLLYAYSENFVLPISHDEVVHGKGSLLAKMPGDAWQQFANLRAYYGFMWGHPGKKLLFMGGEFAQRREWNHDSSLDWHLLDIPEHRGVQALVSTPEDYRDRDVVIIGGGDSAFDWCAQLRDKAKSVTLVHRSDRFRAHAATVSEVQAAAAAGDGRVNVFTFHELDGIHGDTHAVGIRLKDPKAKTTREIPCDVVLPMLGYVSDLGTLVEWGLDIEKDEIKVSSTMETARAGVYAAGDITTYPGKLKLIASGFSEAAIAVNQAVHYVYPEKKVTPGHSSNLAIFGQKDE